MIEKLFNFGLKFLVENLPVIEFAQKPEKSGKFVTFIKVSSDLLKVVEHRYEDSHNVRENSHSEKEYKGAEDSLSIGNWIKVTKAYSR